MADALWTGPFVKMTAMIAAVGAVGAFATQRFHNAGEWQPTPPDNIGLWEGIDTPIPQATLALLGNPHGAGRRYVNSFGEEVFGSLVSAGAFENYHDPTVCVPTAGFGLSGKKLFTLDNKPDGCKIRAMVFKQTRMQDGQNGTPLRILMYYWQQNRDGSTDTAARMGNYRDMESRFQTGYGAVVKGNQTVLVRIYTVIAPDDSDGVQAQRNVQEIAQAYYTTLKKEGKGEE